MTPTALIRPDTLYAWKGPCLLIVNTRGECAADELCGFYYAETRSLKTLRVDINGKRPWRCEAARIAPDTLSFHSVHPEIAEPGGGGSGQASDEDHADERGIAERALDIDVTHNTRPHTWIPELVVRNLRVGAARVSLRFWGTPDGRSRWEILDQHGTLHVVRQPPPESLSAGTGEPRRRRRRNDLHPTGWLGELSCTRSCCLLMNRSW